jgi:hypothetical protein
LIAKLTDTLAICEVALTSSVGQIATPHASVGDHNCLQILTAALEFRLIEEVGGLANALLVGNIHCVGAVSDAIAGIARVGDAVVGVGRTSAGLGGGVPDVAGQAEALIIGDVAFASSVGDECATYALAGDHNSL